MSRIIFEDEYVLVRPSFEEVEQHKHSFLHIFFLGNENSCDELYIVGSNTYHTMPSLDRCRLILMIDPTTRLADHLRECVLKDDASLTIRYQNPLCLSDDMSETALNVKKWLTDNGYDHRNGHDEADERIVKLIKEIREYKHFEEKIKNIADEYHLSESRLSHSFRQCTGVSLKGYLSLKQTEYAYRLILDGMSITMASMEAGFSSPSHLAAKCKNEMGISISDVIR